MKTDSFTVASWTKSELKEERANEKSCRVAHKELFGNTSGIDEGVRSSNENQYCAIRDEQVRHDYV